MVKIFDKYMKFFFSNIYPHKKAIIAAIYDFAEVVKKKKLSFIF